MVTCNLSLWSVQCKYSVLFEILSKRLECELLRAVPQTLMCGGGGGAGGRACRGWCYHAKGT